MITTGSVYDKNLPNDGYRVLVMRRWPRGIGKDKVDIWLGDAAPSAHSLEDYRLRMISWGEFAEAYRRKMRAFKATLAHLKELEQEHGHIMLLCWEKEPDWCHRTILKDILDKMKEKPNEPR